MKKPEKSPAKSLEEKRRRNRIWTAAWRKRNPEAARECYRRWMLKKKGTDYKPRKKGAYYGAFDKNFKLKSKKKSGGG